MHWGVGKTMDVKQLNCAEGRQTGISCKRFFAGGQYTGSDEDVVMMGQAYIEAFIPQDIRHPYPLVLFHGAGMTSLCWHETPDGRKGWVEYFLEQGFVVYTFEQPARGRSVYHPHIQGKLCSYSAPFLEKNFTATRELADWPQAQKHTQWPGVGKRGDEVFDAFYAGTVSFLENIVEIQQLVQKAGVALLDCIGPAVLVTHSQAGNFGWLIADKIPQLVKGIVALEPSGPPFENVREPYGPARIWGVTDIPLTYEPPISSPIQLKLRRIPSESPDLSDGIMQEEPARRLPNLQGIPNLIVTSECSYHSIYDQWTSRFLEQAGVKNKFLRLEDAGIRGNGHMVMMEKNNLDIAAIINDWIVQEIG